MGGLEEGRGGGEAAPPPHVGGGHLFNSPSKKKSFFSKKTHSPTPIPPLPAEARPRRKRLVSFLARTRTNSKGTTAELLRSRVRL